MMGNNFKYIETRFPSIDSTQINRSRHSLAAPSESPLSAPVTQGKQRIRTQSQSLGGLNELITVLEQGVRIFISDQSQS